VGLAIRAKLLLTYLGDNIVNNVSRTIYFSIIRGRSRRVSQEEWEQEWLRWWSRKPSNKLSRQQ